MMVVRKAFKRVHKNDTIIFFSYSLMILCLNILLLLILPIKKVGFDHRCFQGTGMYSCASVILKTHPRFSLKTCFEHIGKF